MKDQDDKIYTVILQVEHIPTATGWLKSTVPACKQRKCPNVGTEPVSILKGLAMHPVIVAQTVSVCMSNRLCIPRSMPKHAPDIMKTF